MAGHLKAKGHEVTVYNRSAAKADAWVKKHGGQSAKTPREAAKGCEIVFACVGNDDDVRAVTMGPDGALARHGDGRDLRRPHDGFGRGRPRAARARPRSGVGFVDAPVSGGQAGAENGVLTVMCGGDAAPSRRPSP